MMSYGYQQKLWQHMDILDLPVIISREFFGESKSSPIKLLKTLIVWSLNIKNSIYSSTNVNSLMEPLINLSCHHHSKILFVTNGKAHLNTSKKFSSIKSYIREVIFDARCGNFKKLFDSKNEFFL